MVYFLQTRRSWGILDMSFKKMLREMERQSKAAARENERQRKEMEKQRNKAQREAERRRKGMEKRKQAAEKAAIREAEQQRKEMERQRLAAEKAAIEQRKAKRQQETEHMHNALQHQMNELRTILENGMAEASKKQQILSKWTSDYDIPAVPASLPPPPEKSSFMSRIPQQNLVEKLTGIGKTRRRDIAVQLAEEYKRAVAAYKIAKAQRDAQLAQRTREIVAKDAAKETFLNRLKSRDRAIVERYFKKVLELSTYPSHFPKSVVRLAYQPDVAELVVEFDLPPFESIMPTIKGYKYIKTRDEVQTLSLTKSDERELDRLYEDIIAAITLRSLHRLFAEDEFQLLSLVVFNGMVNAIDKATGQDIRPCLVSVQVSREDFAKLDLARVDKPACLKYLRAQTSPSSKELVPIKPLVELITTDDRFIDEVDVLSGLDTRPNLLDLTPIEFEHLIANLFTRMGFKTGTTKISRDGGVDVIAFDERPLFGGKIIIQAKRYRNTVEVESVRALYGVMQDEGATKGMLVTTSSFGKTSRSFAKDKPIELIDGNALLHYLHENGIEAKIELPK